MVLVYSLASSAALAIPDGLKTVECGGVVAFFEEIMEPPSEHDLPPQAARFFSRNQQLFVQTDILEFRFPTVLEKEADLSRFLETHFPQLHAELARLRGLAQITVYLDPPLRSEISAARSGADYLRAKRDRLHQLAARSAEVAAIEPGVIDAQHQAGRLLLLVRRPDAARQMARLKEVGKWEVAGPFPPSAFAKLLS